MGDARCAQLEGGDQCRSSRTGLPFLATVGSTAPFVGLFGTVIGIYRALINIGIAGQASIDKVAGPVGEALIMTALGLFVAVPAVLAYNWLQRRNKGIAEKLVGFANDVHGYMMSNGAVRPQWPRGSGAAAASGTAATGRPHRSGRDRPAGGGRRRSAAQRGRTGRQRGTLAAWR